MSSGIYANTNDAVVIPVDNDFQMRISGQPVMIRIPANEYSVIRLTVGQDLLHDKENIDVSNIAVNYYIIPFYGWNNSRIFK